MCRFLIADQSNYENVAKQKKIGNRYCKNTSVQSADNCESFLFGSMRPKMLCELLP